MNTPNTPKIKLSDLVRDFSKALDKVGYIHQSENPKQKETKTNEKSERRRS